MPNNTVNLQQYRPIAAAYPTSKPGQTSQATNAVSNSAQPPSASDQTRLNAAASPLDLAYKAALDQINEAVAPYLGEGALQRGLEEGVDVSPEATAGRIADYSLRLFPIYARQLPELSAEEARNRFVDVIQGGIERGFNEARDILDGLKVLNGEVATNIDATFEGVMARLAEFRSQTDPDATTA